MLHVVISANAKNLSSLFLHLISIIIYKSLSLSLYLATSGNLGFRTRQLLKNSILSLRRERILRPEVVKVSGNRVQRGIRETIRRSTGIIPRSSVPRDPLVRQRSRLFDGLFSPFGAHREVQNFANLRDDSHRVLFVLRVRLFADAEQRERLRGLFFGKWNVLRSVFDKEREEKEEKYRIRIRDELLLLSFSTSRKAKREKRDPKIESSDPRETSKTARNCLSKEIYI